MTSRHFAVLTLATALAGVALPGLSRAQTGQPAPSGANPAPQPAAAQNPASAAGAAQGNVAPPVNPYYGGPGYPPLNRGAYLPAGQAVPLGFAPLNGQAAYGPNQGAQMPPYGPGAGQAGPGGWSPMPGSGPPGGQPGYPANQGGQWPHYASTTSGPYPNPSQAARITSTSSSQPPTEDTNRVLRLLRYANSSGGLKWPTALKVLPPGPEVTQAREQIDNLLVEALRESASGQVKPALVENLRHEVKQLRRLWADRGAELPLTEESIQAGRDFLRRLEKALE
jgi:hypothetical protein